MFRQYGPPIMGFLWFPSMLVIAKNKDVLLGFFREDFSGSPAGWMVFASPFMFLMYYQFIGSAFSFLYSSALRCRGEAGEIAIPTSSRGSNRNGSSFPVRPATFLWAAGPTAMLTAILVKVIF
jgi:hypothetical protein